MEHYTEEESQAVKDLICEAVKNCQDLDLLDLVLKMLLIG